MTSFCVRSTTARSWACWYNSFPGFHDQYWSYDGFLDFWDHICSCELIPTFRKYVRPTELFVGRPGRNFILIILIHNLRWGQNAEGCHFGSFNICTQIHTTRLLNCMHCYTFINPNRTVNNESILCSHFSISHVPIMNPV
jgi:hypothetical protein